jgi:TonB family protein
MSMKAVVGWMMLLGALVSTGCNKGEESDQPFSGVGARPDVLPVMLNKDLPFRYPASLYAKKVQANVTLRVFIDKEGQVVAESTHVAESSSIPSLDSAAVRGSSELRFIPAKTRGQAVPVSILFPVYFRHPGAPPLPGDTVLRKSGATPTSTPPASDPISAGSAASVRDTSTRKGSVVKTGSQSSSTKQSGTTTSKKSTPKKPTTKKKS